MYTAKAYTVYILAHIYTVYICFVYTVYNVYCILYNIQYCLRLGTCLARLVPVHDQRTVSHDGLGMIWTFRMKCMFWFCCLGDAS